MTSWRAVLLGFLVATVLGLFGLVLPGIGQLAAGLIGGFVAGYLAGGGLGRGFWHGLLAGALGGILVGLLLGLAIGLVGWIFDPTGGILAGLAGVGVVTISVAIALIMALESAIAGAVGGLLNADDDRPRNRTTY